MSRLRSKIPADAPMSDVSMALANLESLPNSVDKKQASRNPVKKTLEEKRQKVAPRLKAAQKGVRSKKKETDTMQQQQQSSDVSEWDIPTILSTQENIDRTVASRIITLMEADNTIPFIARYRKEQTNNLDPKKLRDIRETYDNLKLVREKAVKIHSAIAKQNKLTADIARSISRAQSMEELEMIYAPFKPSGKHTLAERAREAGLLPAADAIMAGENVIYTDYINAEKKGCTNVEEIQTGVRHIIADIISKHDATLTYVRDLLRRNSASLQCSKTKSCVNVEKTLATTATTNKDKLSKADDPRTYKDLYDLNRDVRNIRSNEVMAINRAEKKKFLSVKLVVPMATSNSVKMFCRNTFIRYNCNPSNRAMLESAVEDGYSRLIEPFIERHYRGELNKLGEREAVNTFVTNLKELLLQSPVRGKVVMGIDPGYTNGCKVAVVLANGSVGHTDTLYMHGGRRQSPDEIRARLRQMVLQYQCDTVVIGDGTASRETEALVGGLIKQGAFAPIQMRYCIMDESGVSIYSVSDAAAEELPELDQNVRSAVSLARRLQDPLVEYIKVEPKHLGVGMYQHDVNEKKLHASLDGVVEECVSFVGVDLNYCSQHVLTKVAGLNAARAKAIIQHRKVHGSFINREQLKDVKGIGPKSYEQCAGFVRINHDGTAALAGSQPSTASDQLDSSNRKRKLEEPSTSEDKVPKKRSKKGGAPTKDKAYIPNYLDQTCIHPESYRVAEMFLNHCGCALFEIGQPAAVRKVKECLRKTGVKTLAEAFGIGEPTMQLIGEGLSQTMDYDIRSGVSEPLFRASIQNMNDLTCGATLMGRVKNVVPFGAFVDIGVGTDALIHVSKIRANKLPANRNPAVLLLGDKVQVRVLTVELARRRIGLDLLAVMSADKKAFT